jgi:hypothetical protein
MEWIAGALAIIGLLIKAYLAGAPARAKEDVDDAIQQGRADIANGNADAISVRIDSVPAIQTGPPGNTAGVGSAEDIERRIGQL